MVSIDRCCFILIMGKDHHPEKESGGHTKSALIQISPKNTPLHLSGEAAVRLGAGFQQIAPYVLSILVKSDRTQACAVLAH